MSAWPRAPCLTHSPAGVGMWHLSLGAGPLPGTAPLPVGPSGAFTAPATGGVRRRRPVQRSGRVTLAWDWPPPLPPLTAGTCSQGPLGQRTGDCTQKALSTSRGLLEGCLRVLTVQTSLSVAGVLLPTSDRRLPCCSFRTSRNRQFRHARASFLQPGNAGLSSVPGAVRPVLCP